MSHLSHVAHRHFFTSSLLISALYPSSVLFLLSLALRDPSATRWTCSFPSWRWPPPKLEGRPRAPWCTCTASKAPPRSCSRTLPLPQPSSTKRGNAFSIHTCNNATFITISFHFNIPTTPKIDIIYVTPKNHESNAIHTQSCPTICFSFFFSKKKHLAVSQVHQRVQQPAPGRRRGLGRRAGGDQGLGGNGGPALVCVQVPPPRGLVPGPRRQEVPQRVPRERDLLQQVMNETTPCDNKTGHNVY